MEQYFSVISLIFFGVVIGFFVFLAFKFWLDSVRSKYTPDDKKEFMVDMYKLQQKWSSRGCYDYSESLGLVIKAFNQQPAPESYANTEYGKQLAKKLKDEENE